MNVTLRNPSHGSPTAVSDNTKTCEPRLRTPIHRARTGCRTCRTRKVKCDERKPSCGQCRKGGRSCEWLAPSDLKRSVSSKRPNATACDVCRAKKLKCVGSIRDVCEKCRTLDVSCVRSQGAVTATSSTDSPTLASQSSVEAATMQHPRPYLPEDVSSTTSSRTWAKRPSAAVLTP
ncbi:uncharacterized protein B0T15DRAFT_325940 [Chaetomium strumarium]|uniref:Zn(2)-C6 fungal-type domain-containing protein n=1 Tax=Chaetomium strumarium TaxID=1170767 RepID=A0AAJ0LY42_9PEZI|nr:hypothetical protein B0T15DRAFT_325940 [Chaetomium strumarium]